MDGSNLAIVIPAHCEANTIGPIVAAARRFGTVLVIDDCSTDETGLVAEAAGATVVRNDPKRGYDGTLNRGFEEARRRGFECVVTMDADGEHDPAALAAFRRLLLEDQVTLVLGIRARKQRLAEVIMGLYIKRRFGVSDILCGMKGYRLSLLAANGQFDHTDSIGTELTINSIRRGVKFAQIPVGGSPREDGPRFDNVLRANWRILSALLRVLHQDVRRLGTPPGNEAPPMRS